MDQFVPDPFGDEKQNVEQRAEIAFEEDKSNMQQENN